MYVDVSVEGTAVHYLIIKCYNKSFYFNFFSNRSCSRFPLWLTLPWSKSLPIPLTPLRAHIASLEALLGASPARKEHPNNDHQSPDSPGHQENKEETGVFPPSLPQVGGAKEVVGERPRLPQVHQIPRPLRHPGPPSLLQAVGGDDDQLARLPEVPRRPVYLSRTNGAGPSSREMEAGLDGEHAWRAEVAEHQEPGMVKCKILAFK